MKKLVCELCGSTDLIKKDGVYVCESCGSKFTLEEARKMLIDGTVNVTGSVRIDESAKLKNYLEQALISFDAKDYNKAENYCDKILENDTEYAQAWILKIKIAIKTYSPDSAVSYCKKAVNSATAKGQDELKTTLKAINDILGEYFEDRFGNYLLARDAKRFYNDLQWPDRWNEFSQPEIFDIERYKKAVNKGVAENFRMDDYFSCRLSIYSFIENYDEWHNVRHAIDYLQEKELLTDETKLKLADFLATEASTVVDDAIYQWDKKKEDNRNYVPDDTVAGFHNAVKFALQAFSMATKINPKAKSIPATIAKLEETVQYMRDTGWTQGGKRYSYNQAAIDELDSLLSSCKEPLTEYNISDKDIDTYPEEGAENTHIPMMECSRCHEDIPLNGTLKTEDEKDFITCPHCGMLNALSPENEVTDDISRNKQDNNSETFPEEQNNETPNQKTSSALLKRLWIGFILSEILILLIPNLIHGISFSSFSRHSSRYSAPKTSYSAEKTYENLKVNVDKSDLKIGETLILRVTYSSNRKSDCEQFKTSLNNQLKDIVSPSSEMTCFQSGDTLTYKLQKVTDKTGSFYIPSLVYNNASSFGQQFTVRDDEELLNAIKEGNLEIIKQNIGNTDLATIIVDGNNAIMHILKNTKIPSKDILSYIKDPNLTDKDGNSLLTFAVVHKDDILLDFLLSAKVNVNYLDKKGRTALMYATIKNNASAVEKLIKNNADLYLSKDGAWTAYKYAKELGFENIAKKIEQNCNEILFFSDDCSSCKSKKETFKKLMEQYPTLKVHYHPTSKLSEFSNNSFEKNPVIIIQNHETGKGWMQQGWDGTYDSLSSLMTKHN